MGALERVRRPRTERPWVALGKCMHLLVKMSTLGCLWYPFWSVDGMHTQVHANPHPHPRPPSSSTARTTQPSQPLQSMCPCTGESKGKITRRCVDLSPIHSFNKYLLSNYPPGMECHPTPTPSLYDGDSHPRLFYRKLLIENDAVCPRPHRKYVQVYLIPTCLLSVHHASYQSLIVFRIRKMCASMCSPSVSRCRF